MVPLASAERLNPTTGLWEVLPPLAVPRHGAAAVSIDSTSQSPTGRTRGAGLYVFGGTAAGGASAAVEVYQGPGKGWRRLADMPHPRESCCGVAARSEGRDVIILAGGGNPAVDVFVVAANKWEVPSVHLILNRS